MREDVVKTKILEELTAMGVSCQMLASKGMLACVDGRRGGNSRSVVLYVDGEFSEQMLSFMRALVADADFEGKLYIFHPIEGFSGVLDDSLFDGNIAAVVMPVVNDEMEYGEVGFCPGKMLASRDEFKLTVTPEPGEVSILSNQVIVALADLIMRVNGLRGEDCQIQIREVEAKSGVDSIPHKAIICFTINCLKDGVRHSVKDMVLNTISELQYKYDVEIDVDLSQCEPCVENNLQLTYEAMLLARNEGYQVRDIDASFSSHRFGYFAAQYPSLLYYYGIGEHADRDDLVGTIVKNILNK